MINEIKTIVARSQSTLIQDVLGAAALLVILYGGLTLPVIL